MSSERNRLVTRIVQRTAVGLVILDVVLYFAALLPIQKLWQQGAEEFNNARLRVVTEQGRVNRLKWYSEAAPSMQKDLDDFLNNEVHSKRKSFSRTTRLVLGLADQSGVSLPPSEIAYHLDKKQDEFLARMGLSMAVTGPFDNLMSFAHDLETSEDDFLILRSFNFESQENGGLTLRLATDFYLTP